MEILIKHVSDDFRAKLEGYFEMRNDSLHVTLKDMDECLNQASIAHGDISMYRMQLLQACNHNTEPPFTAAEDEALLLNGQGIKDLQQVSGEAEHCVMQVGELQDVAATLMNAHAQNIPPMIDTMLSEAAVEMKKADEMHLKQAEDIYQRGDEELNKAVQVLDSMQKVKHQIECLCQILRKPDN
ncbi:hypothetical protein GWK47_010368 [Chionoecetes opilio]|uniref:Uncharacterized protein n=1 Tax=Chionoecetes opilio TaxID=41210 RepID=A0A8J4XY74_CHIOP|nr:hypothetical protein GWK47_010368 [Chionoecetes opilio]